MAVAHTLTEVRRRSRSALDAMRAVSPHVVSLENACLVAYEDGHSLPEIAKASGWSHSVTRNAILSARRRRR